MVRRCKIIRDVACSLCSAVIAHRTVVRARHTSHQAGGMMSPIVCPHCRRDIRVKKTALGQA